MKNFRKIICFCGVVTAVCLTVPMTGLAADTAEFTISDRYALEQDADGHVFYPHNGVRQTGLFVLNPDYLLGDITGNQKVDASDAAEILQAAAETGAGAVKTAEEFLLNRFPEYENAENILKYADIDADSEIDAKDAAQIMIYSAKTGSGEISYQLGYACYYADKNGFLQKGLIQAGEDRYYADENYMLASGWISVEDTLYFADVDTHEILTGFQKIGTHTYLFGEDGVFQKGWNQTENKKYYQTQNRGLFTGWNQIDNKNYYFDADGVLCQNQWQEIEKQRYYFNADGEYLKGFQNIEDVLYYFNAQGVLQCNKWLNTAGQVYYLDESGAVLKGWQSIGQQKYYLDAETGARVSGWFTEDGKQYYQTENGIVTDGWQTIDEKKYYFDADGVMQTGWLTLGEEEYYLDPESGVMATGFTTVDDLHYYFGNNGILQKRKWLFIGGKTYYLGIRGDCLTGWQDLTGYIYYFQPDGSMSEGWTEIDGNIYYFDPDNGTRQTGWLTLNNLTYYLDDDGIRLTGWQNLDGHRYYFNINGVMTTGWATIGDNKYYFYPEDGTLAVNVTIDGYYLGMDGVASEGKLALNKQRAQNALNQYGTSVSAIYNYMRSTNRYKYTESTRTLEQIEANGWLYYVDYAFTHYYGVCYYMAAKMDFILQEAGYECRIVHATHGSGDHYWNQVNIDGTWVNYDCTNGYNAYTWSRIIAAGNYKFLGYVQPVYQ